MERRPTKWHLRLIALLSVALLVLAACGEDTETPDEPGAGASPTEGAIQSLDDVTEDMRIGVQEGTTGQAFAEENLPPNTTQSFPEGPDAYRALEACSVDGVVHDESTALAEVENSPDLEIVQKIDTGEVYGIAVDPAKEPLLDAINTAFGNLVEDGTYDEIYGTYPSLPPGGSITETGEAPEGGEIGDFATNEEGTLLVGSDIPYPPFEFRKDGKLVGLDMDLINAIGDELGVEVVVKDTSFDTIFTQLAAGRYDAVIAASTITPEREKQVNFSEGYFNSQQSLTINTSC